jgi:GNAT superfamily N-acetyltransferase
MDRGGPYPRPSDLAPGDVAATDFDWSQFTLRRVTGADDPEFSPAYDRLWDEFGRLGEMERRQVIAERLGWDPRRPTGEAALLYEMLVVRRGDDLVAIRDHTAVVRRDARGRPRPGPVVVHLSHVLIVPAHRGAGLAAWMRALPLDAARRCAQAAQASPETPVVLVAEMEHPAGEDLARLRRLRSYERAGFQKIDPAAVPYEQPDFRSVDEVGATGPVSVPLSLIIRRVGRERESRLPAEELAAIVESIYAVYARHVPAAAIEPLREAARAWTARQPHVRLVPPTA